jgi:thiamine biosynthesis lipoprotein
MQFFRHRGRRYSHILDPRTGRPADGVLSVTVVAPSAALADGLSTAFFVMGPERARLHCLDRTDIAALFVCPTSRPGRPEIHAFGFGENDVQLLDGS